MKLYGLTGGIACGKSYVCGRLEGLHVVVVDADAMVRDMQAGTADTNPVLARIRREWPSAIAPDGTLDRDELGRIVFADRGARRKLGRIMDWRVAWRILARLTYLYFALPFDGIAVLDAPLLFETKFFLYFVRGTIVIDCPEALQLRRLQRRNGYTETEARNRIGAQMPTAEKVRRADFVFRNDEQEADQFRTELMRCLEFMTRCGRYSLFERGLLAVAACVVSAVVATRVLWA